MKAVLMSERIKMSDTPAASVMRWSAAAADNPILEQCFSKVREISSGSWLTAALHHSKQLIG
jgi:hypothetical protein